MEKDDISTLYLMLSFFYLAISSVNGRYSVENKITWLNEKLPLIYLIEKGKLN